MQSPGAEEEPTFRGDVDEGPVGAGALVLAGLGLSASAHAQTIVDGSTAPVFDYDQAIRERVYIPNGQDADLDGVEDRTAIEIMRPEDDRPKVPAIIEPSPYYTTRLPRQRGAVHRPTSTATASTTAGRCATTTTSSRAATR